MLNDTFNLILTHRSAWNVQRLYWFDWRDPAPGSHYAEICGRCGSAGLLDYDRTPKPAYDNFLSFAAETTPPVAGVTGGPADPTRDATPSFSLASNEAGSTFACRIDSGRYKTCPAAYTTQELSNGPHALSVRAIDAAGNRSTPVTRSFTVDSRPPPAPQIGFTTPKSPANDNDPRLSGSAEPGSTVKLYRATACAGSPIRAVPTAKFGSPGIAVRVDDDTTTHFRARAVDAAGNVSSCSTARAYVEAQATFRCRFDQRPYGPCSGPGQSHTPSTPLAAGPHTFSVQAVDRAKNVDRTAAKRAFTVSP
jgi:hypothetical protein